MHVGCNKEQAHLSSSRICTCSMDSAVWTRMVESGLGDFEDLETGSVLGQQEAA